MKYAPLILAFGLAACGGSNLADRVGDLAQNSSRAGMSVEECGALYKGASSDSTKFHLAPQACKGLIETAALLQMSGAMGDLVRNDYATTMVKGYAMWILERDAEMRASLDDVFQGVGKVLKGEEMTMPRKVNPQGETREDLCVRLSRDYASAMDRYESHFDEWAAEVEARVPEVLLSKKYTALKAGVKGLISQNRSDANTSNCSR